jgi:predicted AAA+ superfamily ATPase
MGNLFARDSSNKDVLLTGLRGAGKTLLLYNALLEEGWTETYRS